MFAHIGKFAAIALVLSLAGAGVIWIVPTPPEKAGRSSNISASLTIERPEQALQPMPRDLFLDDRKIELGRQLFYDKRLSQDGKIACGNCHRTDHGGADVDALSQGMRGRLTEVNVPSMWNSYFNVAQFWDGRVDTLEEQADHPLTNPNEMGSNWPTILARLQADRRYVGEASKIYNGALSPAIVRDAIATYERSLISRGSRFDEFLLGKADALTADEQTGYRLFKEYGCVACHQGAAVGGNMFQRLGIFGDYFEGRGGTVSEADLGRFNVTRNPADRHVFKVPSLRNVVETAPYFHDGSAATLEEAIAIMARYQLGREMPAADIEMISAFLATLTNTSTGSSQ